MCGAGELAVSRTKSRPVNGGRKSLIPWDFQILGNKGGVIYPKPVLLEAALRVIFKIVPKSDL
jgi:hypothetical protein